jgi:hypothetical protein
MDLDFLENAEIRLQFYKIKEVFTLSHSTRCSNRCLFNHFNLNNSKHNLWCLLFFRFIPLYTWYKASGNYKWTSAKIQWIQLRIITTISSFLALYLHFLCPFSTFTSLAKISGQDKPLYLLNTQFHFPLAPLLVCKSHKTMHTYIVGDWGFSGPGPPC